MRRIVGVILAVLGVLLVVARFVIPGGKPLMGVGIVSILIGLLVFGLSFIKSPQPAPDAPPPLSPAERIMGIFYEPARVFQNLRYHPRWFAAFLVIAIFGGVYQMAFTQRMGGERLALAKAEKVIEGGWIPPEKQAQFKQDALEEGKSKIARVVDPFLHASGVFILMLVLAGLFLLLVMIFGGRLNFWQSLCVATYSMLPVVVIEKLLGLILLYIKSPDDIDPIKGEQRGLVRADLSILFTPADHPFLYTLGGMIGLFTIYWLWLLSTGLRNTGEKVSAGSAWGVGLILWFVLALLGLGAAALFPSFVT